MSTNGPSGIAGPLTDLRESEKLHLRRPRDFLPGDVMCDFAIRNRLRGLYLMYYLILLQVDVGIAGDVI